MQLWNSTFTIWENVYPFPQNSSSRLLNMPWAPKCSFLKKWTIAVIKGAMVDSQWCCEQSTLGLLTIRITVQSLLPSTPPCNWKSCIQSRGPPKRMPYSPEILINWSIMPLTHRHKRFAQKELFSTLCSTCLTWFRGLSVEKRINGWPGQKEYTRHTFVLLFEIEVKM